MIPVSLILCEREWEEEEREKEEGREEGGRGRGRERGEGRWEEGKKDGGGREREMSTSLCVCARRIMYTVLWAYCAMCVDATIIGLPNCIANSHKTF